MLRSRHGHQEHHPYPARRRRPPREGGRGDARHVGVGPRRRLSPRVTAERLEADDDYAAIVERYLTRLVDLAGAVNAHIAATTGETVPGDCQRTFDAAAWAGAIDNELAGELRPSLGPRDVLIHAYETTDFNVVSWAGDEGATHYEAYVRQVSAFAARARETGGADPGA